MRSVEVQDDFEALVVEQALAFARELKTSGAAAADGRVLAAVEQVAVVQGRELARKSLEAALQLHGETVEKKAHRDGRARAAEADTIADAARESC